MASPFTELECYIILLSLLVFSLFTLHGMIHEQCTPLNPTGVYRFLRELLKSVMESPFSDFELFFVILAVTVFCMFALVAIYINIQHADNKGESGLMEQKRPCLKSGRKFKNNLGASIFK